MKQISVNTSAVEGELKIVRLNKSNLAVAPQNHRFNNLFRQDERDTAQKNLDLSIKEYGLLDYQPLTVVPDRRRNGEGLYLVAIGGRRFLRAVELRPDIEFYPCIIIDKPLTEVQIQNQLEELLKNSRAKRNLGLILLKVLNDAYEASNRQSLVLSTETKKIIARDAGYEDEHLKSVYRALTPLRHIFQEIISSPENERKSLLEIMLNAGSDEKTQPELHNFLIHSCPFKFSSDFKKRKEREAEIKREISATSDFDFIIREEVARTNQHDTGELGKVVAELETLFPLTQDFLRPLESSLHE